MNKKKLYQRFSKDYNLPINIFDEEIFSYYRELYKEFFPNDILDNVIKLIKEKYDNNVEKWLDYCGEVRDNAINEILNSESYKNFNNINLNEYKVTGFSERSVYTEETNGKYFISIDLKKANFQALKWMNVINDYSYEDFIRRMGGDDYIAGSKYLRQVIFGKCNPSRQITIEKHLMSLVEDSINIKMKNHGFKLYSFNSDELIYEEDFEKRNDNNLLNEFFKSGIKKFVDEIKMMIEKYLNIEVSVEYFNIERIKVVNSNGNKVDAYIKKNFITNEIKYKKISTTFFPQIYKLIKGLDIIETDRIFFFENQLATFNNSLILEK